MITRYLRRTHKTIVFIKWTAKETSGTQEEKFRRDRSGVTRKRRNEDVGKLSNKF